MRTLFPGWPRPFRALRRTIESCIGFLTRRRYLAEYFPLLSAVSSCQRGGNGDRYAVREVRCRVRGPAEFLVGCRTRCRFASGRSPRPVGRGPQSGSLPDPL